MPGAGSVNTEGSCESLCRTLVSQKGLQRETADISQSVLYTSLMGLLLVTDKEVTNFHFTLTFGITLVMCDLTGSVHALTCFSNCQHSSVSNRIERLMLTPF